AVDLAPGVFRDGIVADQGDGPGGPEAAQQEARQQGGQAQAGEAGLGQDAVEAGGRPLGQVSEGAQQVADGAPAGGQDGGHGEELQAQEGRGVAGGGEEGQDRQGLRGYTGHGGLLAASGAVVLTPRIPAGGPHFSFARPSSSPHNRQTEFKYHCKSQD